MNRQKIKFFNEVKNYIQEEKRMSEEVNNVDDIKGVDLLSEVLMNEHKTILSSGVGTEEHKAAFNNFIAGSKVLIETQKIEAETELENDKVQIERERLNLEKEAREIERARIELDREIENNRKADSKRRNTIDYIAIGLDVVGIVFGAVLTMKTLHVNLDSVISDRDAVSSAKKMFDHFSFKKRR